MAAKRWALSVPLDGFSLAEHAEIAREAEALGYSDAWSLEIDGVDCFAPLAVAAMATQMRVGTAIANVFTRGPATLASTAAGLAEIAPGRFCLGLGAGSQPIVEFWNGGTFRRPATRVREMVQVLRQAFAGERVTFQGETLHVNGFRLSRPVAEPIPIHVAALRPGMLRVAGEVGDGAIINWLSAEDVPTPVSIARQAAAEAGRDPEALEITAPFDGPHRPAGSGVRPIRAARHRGLHERAGLQGISAVDRPRRLVRPHVGGLGAGRSARRAGRHSRSGRAGANPTRLDGRDSGARATLLGCGRRHGVSIPTHDAPRAAAKARGDVARHPGLGAWLIYNSWIRVGIICRYRYL